MPAPLLYFAPGSGLGHLTRALALSLELRSLGVETEIATNSPFAESLARLAQLRITQIPTRDWAAHAPRLLEERSPRAAILDTFPDGIRGEWTHRPRTPLIHLARRLRLDEYPTKPQTWHGFALTIAIEALAAEHAALLNGPLLELPGLIRLRPRLIDTPPPAPLERLLDAGASLVIHGGPLEELEQLIALARPAPIAAISPWPEATANTFDYFPAANLLHRAPHIYTGAGYNSIADTMDLRARHTAIPFPRRFDDQAARLADLSTSTIDATRTAAEAIRDTLSQIPTTP